jgi:choline transport protein
MEQSRSTTEEKQAYEDSPIPELQNEKTQNSTSIVTGNGLAVNASGHVDQLQRHYGLLSICGLALTIDNAWVAFGGSLTVSIRSYLFSTDF